jgi:hypothetical protein
MTVACDAHSVSRRIFEQEAPMAAESTITLTLSKADAEVLLGVVSSERYNADVEAVCEGVRKQLDERLAELG